MYSPTPKSKFSVGASPHWHDGSSLPGIQWAWLLALLPAIVASTIVFGWPAIGVIALAVSVSVVADATWNMFVQNGDATSNFSSVTLGILLAFLLPVGAPWWLVTVGAVLTVVMGKKLFGGWGAYPVHPVALGYAMLVVSWPTKLDYTASLVNQVWSATMIEPMRLVRTLGSAAESQFNTMDLLLGNQVAGVGNAMVIWLLVGGLFLVLVRQIPWQIPLGGICGVLACAGILVLMTGDRTASPLFHMLTGSTVLMIFFLAPEHTTSPVNPWPMFLYGLLIGSLLVLLRTFSSHTDGAIFSVLLANICSPLIDRMTPAVVGLEVSSHG
jgi:H+/Na+-translocating ferredoxin:NAD+ oxidoreductase subunit D